MNLEQVAHFIEHPQELTLSDAPALHALSEKYPFASLFSLLYLKALANGKSVDLDSALQQHAYRLNDRRQLFQLIHSGGVVVETAPVTRPETTIPVVADVVHAKAAEIPVIESISEPTVVVPEAVEPEMPPQEDKTTETVVDAGQSNPISEADAIISFEQTTDAFTLEQHYTPEVEVPLPEEKQAATPEPEIETGPETAIQTAATTVAPVIPANEKRSFTDWLKSSRPEIPGLESEAFAESKPTPATAPSEAVKPKVEEIIDTFIREEPTISRGKTEFFSPSKKAKESLDEDALPVSETLAKIYAAQGNYPKAIHVYHQLMLSVPEKRSLFAVQIEALKKKITP